MNTMTKEERKKFMEKYIYIFLQIVAKYKNRVMKRNQL